MNVAGDALTAVALALTKPLVLGYLLTPFGWAAHHIAAIVHFEPGLMTHVFELDKPRMHVIALALAHLDGIPTTPESTVCYAACRSQC